MLSYTSGNGVVNSYVYDANNLHLNNLEVNGPNITPAQKIKLAYQFDPSGNISAITDQNTNPPSDPFYMSQTFTYDALNRLLGAGGAYNASFSYDDIGNITAKTEGSGAVSLGYGSYTSGFYHRPQTAVIAGTNYSYNYDQIGGMTNDGRKTYTYDNTDKLTQAAVTGGTAASFIYNAFGARLMKKVAGQDATYYPSPNLDITVKSDGTIDWRKNYF